MPIHDAWARTTPYELSFPDEAWAEARFRAVAEEAEARGADPGDPETFVMLMAVGKALRDLRGPGEDPERIREHGLLLWHAWHFWKAGRHLHLLDVPTARRLVEATPPAPSSASSAAAYVQLPQHLFWVPEGSGGAPQSVDGFFWTAAHRSLALLLVTGVREDRPGFDVIAVPPLPEAEAAPWATARAREEGEDFESGLPGAELEGLYELRTAGEALKLAVRARRLPAGAAREQGSGGSQEPAASGRAGPRPSTLPWTPLVWTDGTP